MHDVEDDAAAPDLLNEDVAVWEDEELICLSDMADNEATLLPRKIRSRC